MTRRAHVDGGRAHEATVVPECKFTALYFVVIHLPTADLELVCVIYLLRFVIACLRLGLGLGLRLGLGLGLRTRTRAWIRMCYSLLCIVYCILYIV